MYKQEESEQVHEAHIMGSESDLQLKYDESFEAVLKEGDDNSSASSVPPPPPLSFFRSNKNASKKGDVEEGYSIDIVAAGEDDESFEVETTQRWFNSVNTGSPNRRSHKGFICCVALVVVVAVILGLAIGVSNTNPDTQRSSSISEVNDQITAPPTKVESENGTNSTNVPIVTDLDSNSTAAPTNDSTAAPTDSDTTIAPESCSSIVESDTTCYIPGLAVTVLFENCEPQEDDWVGIWPIEEAANPGSLPEPALWLWSCGSQNCAGQVSEGAGALLFGAGLDSGTYVAHIVRLDSNIAPYAGSYGISRPFDVSDAC